MIDTNALFGSDVNRGSFVKAMDLLDGVPDEVILATAADDIDLRSVYDCLVGRLVINGEDYNNEKLPHLMSICDKAQRLFGGTVEAWAWMYSYMPFTRPDQLEEIFAVRLGAALDHAGIRDPQPEPPLDEL